MSNDHCVAPSFCLKTLIDVKQNTGAEDNLKVVLTMIKLFAKRTLTFVQVGSTET